MKKILTAAALTLFLSACGSGSGNSEEVSVPVSENVGGGSIHLFNWGYFLYPTLIDEFEEEFGISVTVTNYNSNEMAHAMITARTQQFDLVIPSDYMIYRMINENLLRPINFNNVPNITNIDNRFMAQPFDPSNTYSVPYKWGSLGIIYDTTRVTGPITSWADMWNPAYAGEIFMYYSERDAFAVAFSKMGVSLNTTDQNLIEEARDLLIEQLPLVQAYITDEILSLMPGGEGIMALAYSGDAINMQRWTPHLNYVIPEEGSNLWINSLVIPYNAVNYENAEKLINFLLRPNIAARNTNWMGFVTANEEAFNQGLILDYLLEIPGFLLSDEEYERLEIFIDLGEEREKITRAFTEVMAH